jgi:hypothetical protein
LHSRIASEYAPDDDLPCADITLLVPLKRSAEFAAIRMRVADHRHLDSWLVEGLHFFVFQHMAGVGAARRRADAPVALFAMHPELEVPVSAVTVTPKDGGVAAEVQDLREPDSVYTAPVASPYTTGAGGVQG